VAVADNKSGFGALTGPLLIAHRGASAEHVENTLPAFEAALGLGADVIESDVHVTRDGQPVLAHDDDGSRVAGDPRTIAQCTLAEVERWDLSRTLPGSEPCSIPTLDAALARLPHALYNLDLKSHDVQTVPRVLEVIARHHAESRVLLTSFSARITQQFRSAGYKGPVGLGQAEAVWAVFAPSLVLRARAAIFQRHGTRLQIPTRSSGIPLARTGLIRKLHALALPIDYWVINDAAEAEHLLNLGAQGIVTDDVRTMAKLFARSPQTAAWRARHPHLI
jgi:glycerophosphoryl diester phosphodiesterase